MKDLLPLTAKRDKQCWSIIDVDGMIVATYLTKEEAEFLVTVANAHYPMLEALEAFIKAWDKSHQLEKTDVARRLAEKAIAQAKAE